MVFRNISKTMASRLMDRCDILKIRFHIENMCELLFDHHLIVKFGVSRKDWRKLGY